MKKKSTYTELLPIFKSLCEQIDRIGNEVDVHCLKEHILNEACILNSQFIKEHPNAKPKGKYISCNIAFGKKKRTHGCESHLSKKKISTYINYNKHSNIKISCVMCVFFNFSMILISFYFIYLKQLIDI